MREAASRGFWVSSYAPYGYNRVMVQDGAKKRPTLEPDPDASRVVKRIFDLAEAGKGMTNITKTLNTEGIASPGGKLWGKTSVHAILTKEAYTGTLVWGTKAKDKAEPVRVEKAFPAIVTKTQFRRVGKLMRSRAPKMSHPRRVGSTYLLSGLVKCKSCNRALSGQDAKSGRFAYYVCQPRDRFHLMGGLLLRSRSRTNLTVKAPVNQLTRTQAEGTQGQENQGLRNHRRWVKPA